MGHQEQRHLLVALRRKLPVVGVFAMNRLIVGVAVVLIGIRSGQFFIALLLGWYVYMNFQQWQYFRKHGFPGD